MAFGIGARVTAMDTDGPRSEWRTDVGIGSHARASHRALPTNRRLSFSSSRRTSSTTRARRMYSVVARVSPSTVSTKLGGGIDLGMDFGRRSELRFGYEHSRLRAVVRTGDPGLPNATGALKVLSTRWTFDSQNSPSVPTRGTRADLSARMILEAPDAPDGVPQAEARISAFHPVNRREIPRCCSLRPAPRSAPRFRRPCSTHSADRCECPRIAPRSFVATIIYTSGLARFTGVATLPQYLGSGVHLGAMYELGGAFSGFNNTRFANGVCRSASWPKHPPARCTSEAVSAIPATGSSSSRWGSCSSLHD